MYAGLSKAKWAINSAFMGLYAFSGTLIPWVLYAYNSEVDCGVEANGSGIREGVDPDMRHPGASSREWHSTCTKHDTRHSEQAKLQSGDDGVRPESAPFH